MDVQVKVSARHGHLNPETQQVIHDKAEKLLHFFERVTLIEVILDLRGEAKKAEVLLNAEHKHDFTAHAEAEDVLIAVNVAIDKMKVQLKHYKEKIQDHRHTPPQAGVDIKKV